jgi:hypothetical protein
VRGRGFFATLDAAIGRVLENIPQAFDFFQ